MKNPDHLTGRPSADARRRDNSSDREKDVRGRPLHEEISAHARDLWEKYGRPSGRDEQIWLEAEQQLLGASNEIKMDGGNAMDAETLRQTEVAPEAAATPSQSVDTSSKPGKRRASR